MKRLILPLVLLIIYTSCISQRVKPSKNVKVGSIQMMMDMDNQEIYYPGGFIEVRDSSVAFVTDSSRVTLPLEYVSDFVDDDKDNVISYMSSHDNELVSIKIRYNEDGVFTSLRMVYKGVVIIFIIHEVLILNI